MTMLVTCAIMSNFAEYTTFAIMQVRYDRLTTSEVIRMQKDAPKKLPRPIILASPSPFGYDYLGDQNVIKFLNTIPPTTIPWDKYQI